ncbi:MAG TPA: FKBP-type peptidyl-prolyl cis-trans isomerase [Bacteroidia bacterium]
MTIDKNKVVSVNYHLSSKFENEAEELVEQTSADRPFVFLYGAGGLIPKFEQELAGKKVGDKFDFRVNAADGYGMYNEEYVAEIPKEAFFIEGKFDETQISVGKEVPMMDAEGNQMYGLVLEVADKHVAMDFNHPLAGHDLHFVGEVLEVRDATAEELDHGHVHGPGGHHH